MIALQFVFADDEECTVLSCPVTRGSVNESKSSVLNTHEAIYILGYTFEVKVHPLMKLPDVVRTGLLWGLSRLFSTPTSRRSTVS